MLSPLTRPAIATVLACVALAATSAAAAEAPPSQSLIFEGPGGRAPLTQWVLRKDPANSGLRLGWKNGAFSGTNVRVPNVVNARPFSGPAGGRNYSGSIAWYRTTVQAPAAGRYVFSFQTANYRADIYIDGRPAGSHRGSYLPFSVTVPLSAGGHALVVRVDWRFPKRQAEEGFHRTWFNWGGLDGEVDMSNT